MGNGCSGRTQGPVWGYMDEDQRNQAIESNPIEAGKLIDAWFFDKWQRFNPKLPEVNEEELSGNLGWVRFIQFQDEVFTSRDKMWAKCMEQSAQTNANKCKEFLQVYLDHLVQMCEAFNPNLGNLEGVASAAHVLPSCAGRAHCYELCVNQFNDYANTLSEYSELSESYKFKQEQLKALSKKLGTPVKE